MTSGSPSSRNKPQIESRNAPSSNAAKLEHRSEKLTTEDVATALLNPVVPPGEKQEYTYYVEHCQELVMAQPDYTVRNDMIIYENVVAIADMGDEDEVITLQDPDLKVFEMYVDRSSPAVAEGFADRDLLPISFYYEKWINCIS